jgi:hypothetical protein
MTAANSAEMRTGERGPIFDEVPSGLDIMGWFLDKTLAREWVGCGGDADYILSWDPETQTGSHLDLLAHVDHDDRWHWLLDVGTQRDGGETTHDLLFVTADLDSKRSCEWRNEPTTDSNGNWGYKGLVWFAGRIESAEGREPW